MKVAIVGGTGAFGRGLAARWREAGVEITIGSRDAARAQERAAVLGVSGATNEEAVRDADLVVLAVQSSAAKSTIRLAPSSPSRDGMASVNWNESLPDYEHPPVVETVLGVQFDPIRDVGNAQLIFRPDALDLPQDVRQLGPGHHTVLGAIARRQPADRPESLFTALP